MTTPTLPPARPDSHSRGQLSLFGEVASPTPVPGVGTTADDRRTASEEPPSVARAEGTALPPPRPTPAPGTLPEGASFWGVSYAGDGRDPRRRVEDATARYLDRFGRPHALVAVPAAEADDYATAAVNVVGDPRLAAGCVYLLHPPGGGGRPE